MGHKPDMPTYNTDRAEAEQNRLNQAAGVQKYANVNSPLGGYSISVDPDTGRMTVNKVLSDNSVAAQNAQYDTLKALSNSDPSTAENAYYNAQMAYLQPQLQRQVTRTESGLTNRGIPLGSSAWNEATGDVYNSQNQMLGSLSDSALGAGQQYQSNMITGAGLAGNQVVDPSLVGGANGAGLYNTYDKKYEHDVNVYKTKLADYNSLQSLLFPSIGSVLGGVGGSIASGSGNNANTINNTGNYVTDIYGNRIGYKGGYGIGE